MHWLPGHKKRVTAQLPGKQNLIRMHGECIKVKEEDTDWHIYHVIAGLPAVTVEELSASTGFSLPAVTASIARLERSLLVEQKEGKIRALNFGECLIRNQIKYEKNLPYYMENGVIKERKR
jgi:predicted transcriptional regulator